MDYRKDFPGLLVSDPRDNNINQDAQNAPFGADVGGLATSVMPLDMTSATMPLPVANNVAPPTPQLTRLDRVQMGAKDPFYAAAQNVAHLPFGEDMENLLGRGYAYLADPNLDTSGIVAPSMDSIATNRENAYQAQRRAAGQSGFDAYRLMGSLPISLAFGLAKTPIAGTLGGSILNSAAANMFTQPVTHDTYWAGKAAQAIKGVAQGGVIGGWQKQASDYWGNLDDALGDSLLFPTQGLLY